MRTERMFLPILALLLPVMAQPALAQDKPAGTDWDWAFEDLHFISTMGLSWTSGNYGTNRNTNVELALPAISLETGDFKFTASLPYMRISGRGLVVFDSVGNPIVINRNTAAPPDVRTGWGDLNLSASYTVPAAILAGFEVKVSGLTKLPTGPARRRLNTGETDFGASIDVSRRFGDWNPFLTVGYLVPGKPTVFTLYNTTSVSAGTTLELNDHLVAMASYDWDSASTPLVPASHELFGSLSWVRDDKVTLSGYTTVGLSDGSPQIGVGVLISYSVN